MDQHYIPQCYLKGFADAKNKVWRKLIRSKYPAKIKSFNTAGLAYGPDFYKIKGTWQLKDTMSDPNIIEHIVNRKYEKNLEVQIRKLSSGISISFPEKHSFAQTIIHLKRRNPYFREIVYSKKNLLSSKDRVLRDLLSNNKSMLSQVATIEGLSLDQMFQVVETMVFEMIEQEDSGKEFHNLSLLGREQQENETLQNVYNYMASAKWTILESPGSHPFITSDNPGFLIDSFDHVKNMGFEGQFRFYFPLRSSHLLLISKTSESYENMMNAITVSSELVTRINNGIAMQALNQIIGRNMYCLERSVVIHCLLAAYNQLVRSKSEW